jgi:hypothetical protein
MLVEVHHTGEQFQAFDSKGNRITNREILEAISFENFPGFKSVFTLELDLDNTRKPVIMQELDVNINIESR